MSFDRFLQTASCNVILLGALALTGCTVTSPIQVNDRRVFQPSASVTINLSDGDRAASQAQTGHAIEIAVVKASGGSGQTLATGQAPIIFNGEVFSAPLQVRNEFNLTHTSLSWRWRKFFRERSLGLELSAGLGHSTLGLTVSSVSQSASGRVSEDGPQGSVGMIWRTDSGGSVNLRVSGFINGTFKFSREELFFAQALGESVSLRAGYANWKVVNSDGMLGLDSNALEMNFSGPMINLGLCF